MKFKLVAFKYTFPHSPMKYHLVKQWPDGELSKKSICGQINVNMVDNLLVVKTDSVLTIHSICRNCKTRRGITE